MAKRELVKDLDKVIVRLPDGMRDKLKAIAELNNRSLNAEITARLEATFSRRPLLEMVDDMRDELSRSVQTLASALDAIDNRDTRTGVLAAVQTAMGVDRGELLDDGSDLLEQVSNASAEVEALADSLTAPKAKAKSKAKAE